MPFKKVGTDDYTSPSGRHFDSAQVRLYYANGGKFPGQKTGERTMSMSKGHKPINMGYAAGGPVLGRTRDFMKEPDVFRTDIEKNDYAAKGSPAKRTGDKSEKAVKPRK